MVKKNLMQEIRDEKIKNTRTRKSNNSEVPPADGGLPKSREGKHRVDIYLSSDQYSKLALLGAQANPYRRPNKQAETIVISHLASSK